jgi:hypothetical protein
VAHSHRRPYSPYGSLCLAVSEAFLADNEPFPPTIGPYHPRFERATHPHGAGSDTAAGQRPHSAPSGLGAGAPKNQFLNKNIGKVMDAALLKSVTQKAFPH